MHEVELKEIKAASIDELMEVAVESYKQHYAYLWKDEASCNWYVNKSFSRESLLQQFLDEDAHFYLILNNSKTIGFCKLNCSKVIGDNTPIVSAELERIYLLKEVTGKGIGKKVLDLITDIVRGNHKLLWLKSMDSSPSVVFYKKCGFQIVKTEILPFEGLKEEYRRIYKMEKILCC